MNNQISTTLVHNSENIKVLTPTGYRYFSGVSKSWHEEVIKIKTDNNDIKVGVKHKFLTLDGWTESKNLKIGDILVDATGNDEKITEIEVLAEPQWMYDLLDVESGNSYIANGLICHNCEFLSSDALLISSLRLIQLREKAPLWESLGFKFWVPEDQIGGANKIYLVGLDPATGTGSDFSVIEVFEFPSMMQIAEFRSNEINIPLLYAKLSWILKKLSTPVRGGIAEVTWTFERNGIGEAIGALYFNDENQVESADLFSDHASKFGVYTTGKNKILSCLQLKTMVEKIAGGININSGILIHELKNFASKGGGYEAKIGATDDAVMATILIMRLLKRLSEYNEDAFKQVNEYVDPDGSAADSDSPLPMIF